MVNYKGRDYDFNYKKIEAMYWKNCSIEQICMVMSHMPKFEVIDIIQIVEGRKHQKEEREARKQERQART